MWRYCSIKVISTRICMSRRSVFRHFVWLIWIWTMVWRYNVCKKAKNRDLYTHVVILKVLEKCIIIFCFWSGYSGDCLLLPVSWFHCPNELKTLWMPWIPMNANYCFDTISILLRINFGSLWPKFLTILNFCNEFLIASRVARTDFLIRTWHLRGPGRGGGVQYPITL